MSVGFSAPERGEQGHVANFCVIMPKYLFVISSIMISIGKKVADLVQNLGTFWVPPKGVTSNDVLLVCEKICLLR